MPSQAQLDDLLAREAKARDLEQQAHQAEEAGDLQRASDLLEDASVAWGDVAHHCFLASEDNAPRDAADLACWAAQAWLARYNALRRAAYLMANKPFAAQRIQKMAEYCLAEAAKNFEACGSIRRDHGNPDGARAALARAENCLMLCQRLIRKRDPTDPEAPALDADLERVRRKLRDVRVRSYRRKKKKKGKKKRAGGARNRGKRSGGKPGRGKRKHA